MTSLVIRGGIQWDQQEYRRRTQGNRCISFGAIPDGQAKGEPNYKIISPSWHNSWTPKKAICTAEQTTIEQKIRYFSRLEA